MAKITIKKESNKNRVIFYIKTVTEAVDRIISMTTAKVSMDDEVSGHECLEYLLTVGGNVFRDCIDTIIKTYAKATNGEEKGYKRICRDKDFQDEVIKNITTGIVHVLRTSELVGDCEMRIEEVISKVIDNLKNGEFRYTKCEDDENVVISARYDSGDCDDSGDSKDSKPKCPKCNCS